jgi:hypothetical protein
MARAGFAGILKTGIDKGAAKTAARCSERLNVIGEVYAAKQRLDLQLVMPTTASTFFAHVARFEPLYLLPRPHRARMSRSQTPRSRCRARDRLSGGRLGGT